MYGAAWAGDLPASESDASKVPSIAQSEVAGEALPRRCERLAFRVPKHAGLHPAGVDDLLDLRDFGARGLDMAAPPGFAVSPEGLRLAVQVRQAEPESNSYCQALLVFDLRHPAAPIVTVMMSDELARSETTLYGMNGFPSGNARPLTPQWSPNGKRLAFIQRSHGHDGLFVVPAVGGQVTPVARPAADVLSFSWVSSGRELRFETDAPLRQAEARLVAQGREGYRYDDRFWMLAEPVPFTRGKLGAEHFRVAVSATGEWGTPEPVSPEPSRDDSDHAWVEMDKQPLFAFRSRVHVAVGGTPIPCQFDTCENAGGAWWSSRGKEVVFLRREGVASSRTGIYRWRPGGSASPRRIAEIDDALTGCSLEPDTLLCGRERSASPRDIVAIDSRSGRIRQLVDLNPEWREVAPARITRLHWTNRFGIPAIGDLVLPGHLPAGARLPLVVVQYETRGFLRGGTGDEYPIRAMAAAGFAVLSISRPLDYNTWLARRGEPLDQKELMEHWTDRQNAHDSLLKALGEVRGSVPLDLDHLAITGLSDGASTATYALIHSRIFSLALLSTCCEDPGVTTSAIGPAYEEMLQEYQYPLPWQEHRESWLEMSPAMNAQRVCARIQVQAADREARMALSSVKVLREAGVPIEMYVFPDEYHVKWQPAHRAAIYRRNLDTLREWYSKPPIRCFSSRLAP